MNLDAILTTMKMIGADAPAYLDLFEQVLALFSEQDQKKLQESYAEAMAQSDAAHAAAQAV